MRRKSKEVTFVGLNLINLSIDIVAQFFSDTTATALFCDSFKKMTFYYAKDFHFLSHEYEIYDVTKHMSGTEI